MASDKPTQRDLFSQDHLPPLPSSADMAAYKRAWRLRMKALGTCSCCGGRPAVAGRSRCQPCIGTDKTGYERIGRARYQSRAAVVGARDKAERDRWRAEGLCTFCGAMRDDLPRVYCAKCTAYKRTKLAGYVAARKAAGLCPKCAADTGDGYRCAACLAKERASYRRQMAADPVRFQARLARRRLRIRSSERDFNAADIAAIRAAQDGACLMCGKREPEITLHIDHVLPLSKGGSNGPGNIQLLCERDNKSKGARHIDLRHLARFPDRFPSE